MSIISLDRIEVGCRCGFHQVGHVLGRLRLRNAGDEFLQQLVLLGSELLDDVRQQVLDGLGLWVSTDDEGIVLDGGVSCMGE